MSKPRFSPKKNAALVLADGSVFFGYGFGFQGSATGEICFNTAMSGYQEVLTDPSYTSQIVTFTTPHIGNIGCNDEDLESKRDGAVGLITREIPRTPSNFRSTDSLGGWLAKKEIPGIAGIDTRALTKHIREQGTQNVAIAFDETADEKTLIKQAKAALEKAPNMKGLELASQVSTKETYEWTEPLWALNAHENEEKEASAVRASEPSASGASANYEPSRASRGQLNNLKIVALDYGVKHNILRHFASLGCRITVMPANSSVDDILKQKPDGVFLSNGPGDPSATATYAVPVIQQLLEKNMPLFGICMGHQLLATAMGAATMKMAQGHRGANHPVQDLQTHKVEITSQNHGFAVSDEGLPSDVIVTHRSLFDGTVQGVAHKTKPAFSVQGHPEASPGPHDSHYLFMRFIEMIQANQKRGSHAA